MAFESASDPMDGWKFWAPSKRDGLGHLWTPEFDAEVSYKGVETRHGTGRASGVIVSWWFRVTIRLYCRKARDFNKKRNT